MQKVDRSGGLMALGPPLMWTTNVNLDWGMQYFARAGLQLVAAAVLVLLLHFAEARENAFLLVRAVGRRHRVLERFHTDVQGVGHSFQTSVTLRDFALVVIVPGIVKGRIGQNQSFLRAPARVVLGG